MRNDVDALMAQWKAAASGVPDTVSALLRTLDGPVAAWCADVPHYAASTMKLAVLAAVLREIEAGRLDLTTELQIRAAFTSAASGLFELRQADDQDDATWAHVGERLPVVTLLERMVTDSSNIATNVLVEQIGFGPVRGAVLAAQAAGITVNRLIGDERAEALGRTNTVTVRGLAQLLSALAAGRLLPAPATRRALEVLARQKHRSMIPAGLPTGTWSASKSGSTAAVRHDLALVRPSDAPPYVLAVCTSTGLDEAAERLVARLSAITWDHWMRWHES